MLVVIDGVILEDQMLTGLVGKNRTFQYLGRNHDIERIVDPSLHILLLQSLHPGSCLLQPKLTQPLRLVLLSNRSTPAAIYLCEVQCSLRMTCRSSEARCLSPFWASVVVGAYFGISVSLVQLIILGGRGVGVGGSSARSAISAKLIAFSCAKSEGRQESSEGSGAMCSPPEMDSSLSRAVRRLLHSKRLPLKSTLDSKLPQVITDLDILKLIIQEKSNLFITQISIFATLGCWVGTACGCLWGKLQRVRVGWACKIQKLNLDLQYRAIIFEGGLLLGGCLEWVCLLGLGFDYACMG